MTAIAKTNSDLDSRITAYADAIVRNAHVMNGVKHIEIPCSLLRLDEAYQRKESGYAGRIAEQWDNHKAKDIIVSYRDSEFKVIDGANRVRAAQHVLHDFDDNDVRAEVYWATVENAINEVREEDAR